MSALPPKADIGTQRRHVGFGPEADIRRLVALVGPLGDEMPQDEPIDPPPMLCRQEILHFYKGFKM
jgi:hypothetical protein